MYSPYGSYSSMSSTLQSHDQQQNSSQNNIYTSCAFPSWPQGSSLSYSAREQRATSYLSDEDLFPVETLTDDAHSISSASSTASASPYVTEEELLELQRQKMAMQRKAIEYVLNEKERRRQQQKRQRRSSGGSTSSSKKSSSEKVKQDQMAPIKESRE